MEKRPFGYELLLDLYKCDADLNSVQLSADFLNRAVEVLGVGKQAPPYVFLSPSEYPDKAGISGWVPLIESGIQIHTLTPKSFVSIDYYTCSVIDKEVEARLMVLAKEYFSPLKISSQFLLRGKEYYD